MTEDNAVHGTEPGTESSGSAAAQSSTRRAVHLDRPRPEVALVTLEHLPTLNSMTERFVEDLSAILRKVAADSSTRALILTGAGRAFSSGHALDELDGLANDATLERLVAHQRRFSDLVIQIHELPQPVIAAVNGPAAGGGMAMALAADTRVCDKSARFNAAFARLGVSGCDVGVSYLLPRIVSPTLAFEMMLTGRLVDADEALRSGLVLDVVEPGRVLDKALAITDDIVSNSPLGMRMTKEVMHTNLDATSLRHAIALEDRTQVLCLQSRDYQRPGRPSATSNE